MIKFGTSGFRGIVADNFTKENIQKVAYGFVKYLQENGFEETEIVIGYDNRFLGVNFAKWFAEVVCAYGVTVNFYTCSVPSNLISYSCKKYDFGVMFTASHNPHFYNGIKIFLSGARECDDTVAKAIEKFANEVDYESIISTSYENAIKENYLFETENIRDYCNSILNLIDVDLIRRSNLKILLNPMNGSSRDCLEKIFNELEVDYAFINDKVDPYFRHILPAPYRNNLLEECKKTKEEGYDACFNLDGDGDRFACIDKSGRYLDCNYIMPIIYYYYVTVKGYKGSLAKNYSMSNLNKLLCKYLGTKCYEVKVGFKNIALKLLETDAFLGGEPNGVAFIENILSKDGVYASAILTEIMAYFNKSIVEILEDIQQLLYFPQEIYEYAYNITAEKKQEIIHKVFEEKQLPKVEGKKAIDINYDDGLKITYENDYWASIRLSGTESAVRIFVEFKDKAECDTVTKAFEDFLDVHVRQQ